jgi:hypothetical protein
VRATAEAEASAQRELCELQSCPAVLLQFDEPEVQDAKKCES